MKLAALSIDPPLHSFGPQLRHPAPKLSALRDTSALHSASILACDIRLTAASRCAALRSILIDTDLFRVSMPSEAASTADLHSS